MKIKPPNPNKRWFYNKHIAWLQYRYPETFAKKRGTKGVGTSS